MGPESIYFSFLSGFFPSARLLERFVYVVECICAPFCSWGKRGTQRRGEERWGGSITHRFGPRRRPVLGAQLAEGRRGPQGDSGRCRPPPGPRQAVSPQRAGEGGAGAGLPSSGASDKDLQGLGAPGRCDKAAGGRGDRGAPPRLEASALPPGTGPGTWLGSGAGHPEQSRPPSSRVRAAKMAAAAVTASRTGLGVLVAASGAD